MARYSLAFLAIGLVVLGVVLATSDLTQTLHHVFQVGWLFCIVLLMYLGEILANTVSWRHTFHGLPSGPGTTLRLLRVMLAGEAINLVSAHVGGEGAKLVILKHVFRLSYGESAASLVLFRTMNILTLILFSLAGLGLAILGGTATRSLQGVAIVGFVLYATALIVMLVSPGLRVVSRAGDRLLRGRTRQAIEHIVALENRLLEFYRTRRRALFKSAFFSLLNWVLGVVTLYYTFAFVGAALSWREAWIAETFIQLVRAASFFVPAHLGAQEGAFVIVSTALIGSPEAGLAASFVRRGREIFFVATGIAVAWRERAILRAGATAPIADP